MKTTKNNNKKNNKKIITLSIDENILNELNEIVEIEGFNRSRLINKLITDFINDYKNKNNN
jgi:metal-responsive CopG/Arc/MetJ family transcriptional regulator